MENKAENSGTVPIPDEFIAPPINVQLPAEASQLGERERQIITVLLDAVVRALIALAFRKR